MNEYETNTEQPREPVGGKYYDPNLNTSPSMLPMERPHKKKNHGTAFVATALAFSLIGGAVGAGAVIAVGKSKDSEEAAREQLSVMLEGQRQNSVIEIVNIDTGKQMTAAEVYAANVNSTVGITTSITTNYWGFQTTSAASGSGFIISSDGYILTNYHVIEGANSITVSLYDGTSYDAALIGYDESNDIAVLKVEAENLTPVILGDSDNLNVGDSVVAIGNPLGELTFSLTAGLVSAMDREVTLSSSVTMNLIQTDCAINSGNSGGALFNLYGEVIGVTNAKYSSTSSSVASIDNIGFAIPINSIRSIVESIIEKGYISKPYIGIGVLDVSAETQMYGVPAGIAVQSVMDGAPAAEAGLQVGDVITAVNGTALTSDELVDMVGASSVGDTLELSIYRKGETLELTVTVGEQIQSALANEETQQSQQSIQGGYPFGGRR
ncbi:MAG: trypsin-like peptidase domain-containing protein [Oscillospiraceae bacterium]|nr:trypsin-like peptidase domain-containing protein [Oscillospiraceae bacterium]